MAGLFLSGCPNSGARPCDTNADCNADERCVLLDGNGTCAVLKDEEPPADSGVPADAGNGGDAGPTDAGPTDAGPDAGQAIDAGPTSFAITSDVAVGAASARGGELRLRARVRAAEQSGTAAGGAFVLSPPRR